MYIILQPIDGDVRVLDVISDAYALADFAASWAKREASYLREERAKDNAYLTAHGRPLLPIIEMFDTHEVSCVSNQIVLPYILKHPTTGLLEKAYSYVEFVEVGGFDGFRGDI